MKDCMRFNDGYPNFENILHNDDDSSFKLLPCDSIEDKDSYLYKYIKKIFSGRKNFLYILYSHIGVRLCRSSMDETGRLYKVFTKIHILILQLIMLSRINDFHNMIKLNLRNYVPLQYNRK